MQPRRQEEALELLSAIDEIERIDPVGLPGEYAVYVNDAPAGHAVEQMTGHVAGHRVEGAGGPEVLHLGPELRLPRGVVDPIRCHDDVLGPQLFQYLPLFLTPHDVYDLHALGCGKLIEHLSHWSTTIPA